MFIDMFDRNGRYSAALAVLLVVVFVLGCNKFGKSDVADANKLIQDANAKIKEIDKIQDENEKNVRELEDADKKHDAARVKSELDTLIKAIDEGLKLGDDAAGKFEEASKKDIDPKAQEYLKLTSDSLRKKIDAFKERREAARIMRENYDSTDQDKLRVAIADFRKKNDNYKKLLDEAKDLARKADKIAQENPDKIKPQ
jgi:hypothetical protein